ncbi:hypothetical protein L228DRAFT_263322 [Xylona heveae TC161]|uniref:Uncharacterized protein n=1 Tax=Xylona heveae (strain CBS 132557 / TC161) TaxID=1328760 RepID=A0A165A6B0_XYLHT|nr:hypothetical protein L228DRAFT_263322 [Xylona heveae TC161]KZF20012.1 hypothetical protein L228DRAFT_263322 [Xylona heveae TC161]
MATPRSSSSGDARYNSSASSSAQTSYNVMSAAHPFDQDLPILILDDAGFTNVFTNVTQMPKATVNHHTELMNLLGSGKIKQNIVRLFSIMINMIKHIHIALFHASNRHIIEDPILEQVMRVTYSMIMAYDTIQRSIQGRFSTLCDLQLHLPRLESLIDPYELRSAVVLWIERLRAVQALSKAECHLYFHFAEFYEEQIYHSFLQKHRADPEHDIWELAAHLNSVYAVVEDVAILSRQFAATSEIVRQSIYTALERLNETPRVWAEDRKVTMCRVKLERSAAEAGEQFELKLSRSAEIKDLRAFKARVERDLAAIAQSGRSAALKRQPATRKPSSTASS